MLFFFFELIQEEGGMTGSLLAGLLVPSIGAVGTYVVVIICMIICVVGITGKSALKGVKSQSSKAYSRAKADAARRQEAASARMIARRAVKGEAAGNGRKRADRHVEGVSFDTALSKKSPEMKEIQTADEEKTLVKTRKKKTETVRTENIRTDEPIGTAVPETMAEPQFVINRDGDTTMPWGKAEEPAEQISELPEKCSSKKRPKKNQIISIRFYLSPTI